MAQLVLPITQVGLELAVLIGPGEALLTSRLASGQPMPIPFRVRGLLDTSSSVTRISSKVVESLGLPHGSDQLHEVSLGLLDPKQGGSLCLALPAVAVSEAALGPTEADVLIGWNVLLEYRLVIDGPGRVFTLEF